MQALFEAEIAEVAGPKDKHDPNRAARPACPCRSTGEPKGVKVTRDAAMNIVEFITRHRDRRRRSLFGAPYAGERHLGMDIFVTLRSGGSIVVVDEPQRTDPWAGPGASSDNSSRK
ncbi:hypothetical protein Mkiyose1088_34540 [Mycobacterium kiyosense]|nr:hypothetical protein A5725_06095 [Mycobacterium kubicae]BDE17413.1 hypothetical protein MKCMC460_62730 [Mycobacterium sp. 20KCMC460]GLC05158.1 hypothetical protein SRL2020400_57490 [Mycobacterium kiyosense]GLD01588.1 hypothetical protein Mkiyose1088_34540 [Mycobacterium kiyosense]GLD09440.1 hypothetical protein Mkiyose1383_57660 [Mycobacterium kiyosense]